MVDFVVIVGENQGAGMAIAIPRHVPAVEASDDMTTPTDRTTPTSVYRYYDDVGALLYVGMTRAGILRNRQHNDDKIWWQWVVSQRVEHFASAEMAHAREIELIRKHLPPFNKQHNVKAKLMRTAYLAMRNGESAPVGFFGKRRYSAVISAANWKIGLIDVSAYIPHMRPPDVTVAKRPVINAEGRVIGHVNGFERDDGTINLSLRIKNGWRFSALSVRIATDGNLKTIDVIDATYTERAA
jgi:hypothetical protein